LGWVQLSVKKKATKTIGLPIGPLDLTRYDPNAWVGSSLTYIIIVVVVVVVVVVVFYYIIIKKIKKKTS